jgi:hypothetical protein
MNDSAGTNSPLGNQGSQDFNSMLGGGAPSTPAAPTTVAPTGNTDGGAANRPPQTLSRPLRETNIDPAQGQTPPPQDDTTPPAQVPAQQDGQQQQTPVVPPAQVQTPPGTTDQTALVQAAVEAGIRASREGQQSPQQQTQQPAPRMSDEQFAAHYRIPQVTPQHIETIMGQDPQRAAQALNALLRDTMSAALRMSSDVVIAETERVRGEFNPHITSWQAYQKQNARKAAEASFYSMYPNLAEEKALVNEVRDAYIMRVKTGQVSFRDEKEAFAAVANTVNNLVSRFKPQGTNGQPAANGQQAPTTGQAGGRQMSAASSAGRTGTGQVAAAKTDVDQIFGADAR